MAFKDDIEVSSSTNSSFKNEFDDNCHDIDDDDDDDEVSKLMSKYKSLLSKKNHYKHELTSLTKKFKNWKNEFSIFTLSNAKLVNDLKKLKFLGRTTQESK